MDNHAFTLLAVIAFRAKRTNDFSVAGLQIGECLLGDYNNYGMSEQKYRSAKSRLQRYGLATFRTTNRGTIATLSNSVIYDINPEEDNGQINEPPTNSQRTINEPTTTIKNDNNVKNDKNAKEKEIFDTARRYYPDRKRGLNTEFDNFVRKHKDWREVLPLIEPAIKNQIVWRLSAPVGTFVPHWKNFQTWINRRCWEEELPPHTTKTSKQVVIKHCFVCREPATEMICTGRGEQDICTICLALLKAAPNFIARGNKVIPKHILEPSQLETMILKQKGMR